MRLFGWTLTRTPPPPPIVRPGAAQGPVADPTLHERMNQLETRLERVELDNGERQLEVLGAMEKVLNQLRARERKRERLEAEGPEELQPGFAAGDGGLGPPSYGPVAPAPALLARRFRRF